MRFVEKCDELCILLSILLSYFIHHLQPLNVFLFLSLLHYYLININILIFDNVGLINLSKRTFWSFFLLVWKKAFTSANIASGFIKTRIFFYNPRIVFDVIMKPVPAIAFSISVILKMSVLTCYTQKIYENIPICTMIKKLILKNEKLTAQYDLDKYMI